MPTYVVLLSWTEQGALNARETVDRYEASKATWEQAGITFRDAYWTIGPYDVVATVDAPDDETLSAGIIGLGQSGNVRTTTMRAFSADEMRGVLGKIPG